MAIHVNENGTIQELASQSKGDIKLQKVDYLYGPYTVSCGPNTLNGPNLKELAQSENLKLLADYQNSLPVAYYPAIVREYEFEPSVALIMINVVSNLLSLSNPSISDAQTIYTYNHIIYYDIAFLSKDIPIYNNTLNLNNRYAPGFAYFEMGYPLLIRNKIYISMSADRSFSGNGRDFDIYLIGMIFLFA